MNYPRYIERFVERLKGVVIENRPGLDVIAQHDGAETFFYLDPPYPHSTRNMQRGNAAYAVEMSDDEHCELAEFVRGLAGAVLISGYACDLYDKQLYRDWRRVEIEHRADGARPRTEVCWMNYDPPTQQRLDIA